MHPIITILIMCIIGSIIGGMTNFIAIRMLFRPYEAKYMFGKKVPFTPGLIPKRREELSIKVGEMVTHHLLTPEVFKEKIMTTETEQFLRDFLLKQVQTLKEERITLRMISEKFGLNLEQKVNALLLKKMNEEGLNFYESIKHDQLHTLINTQVIDKKVDGAADLLLTKFRAYLETDKSKDDILQMVTSFFMQKGTMINMIKMFMTPEAIAERVSREMVNLTNEPKIKTIIQTEINKEYNYTLEKSLSDFITDEQVVSMIKTGSSKVLQQMNLTYYFNTPLAELFESAITQFETTGVDDVIHYGRTKVADNITVALEKIKIAELIKNRIDQFELSFVEQLVIEISNKELKLITLLGFLLGGVIGLFQGILALFI